MGRNNSEPMSSATKELLICAGQAWKILSNNNLTPAERIICDELGIAIDNLREKIKSEKENDEHTKDD